LNKKKNIKRRKSQIQKLPSPGFINVLGGKGGSFVIVFFVKSSRIL